MALNAVASLRQALRRFPPSAVQAATAPIDTDQPLRCRHRCFSGTTHLGEQRAGTLSRQKTTGSFLPSMKQPEKGSDSVLTRYYTDPLALYIKGMGTICWDLTYCVRLWMESRFKKRTKITRRTDIRNIMRAKADFLRAGPLLVFVPAIALIPLLRPLQRHFPRIFPSTFTTPELADYRLQLAQKRQDSAHSKLLDIVSRLLKEEGNPVPQRLFKLLLASSSSSSLQALLPFISTSKSSQMTLLALNKRDAATVAEFMGLGKLAAMAPFPQLYRWADWILKDDRLISADGVGALTDFEVFEALEERGYAGLSVRTDSAKARKLLENHITFTKKATRMILQQRSSPVQLGKKVADEEAAIALGEHGLNSAEVMRLGFLLAMGRALKTH